MSASGAIPEKGLSRFLYEMREGGRKQANVVFALMFLEVKSRSGNENYGLLSLVSIVLEPAVSVLALGAFYYLLRTEEMNGVPVFLFIAVSMTAFSIIRRSMASVPRAMQSSKGFYSYPNVKPIDAVLARYILEMALTIAGGILVLLFLWWFFGMTISDQKILHALGIFLLLLVAGFGISLFLAVYGIRFPFILKGMAPFTRVLFLTSAVIHPANDLPSKAQWYIAFNPFAHGMELLRFYALNMPCFRDVSFHYFAVFCLLCLGFGLLAYYANRTKVLER